MEKHWSIRQENRKLVLVFLGWASDYAVVRHLAPTGFDMLCIYDYRDMTDPLTEAELAVYDEVHLMAWSFGVWAAEQIMALHPHIIPARAVAFNGTPFPVHPAFGIEPRRMQITLRGIASAGMEPFLRRTYSEAYLEFADVLYPRTAEENIEELRLLSERSVGHYTPSIKWDRAVVGSGDVIFSPQNMLAYWGERAQVLPLPHYPFADGAVIEQ